SRRCYCETDVRLDQVKRPIQIPTTSPTSPKNSGDGGPQPPTSSQTTKHVAAAPVSEIASDRIIYTPRLRRPGLISVWIPNRTLAPKRYKKKVTNMKSHSS